MQNLSTSLRRFSVLEEALLMFLVLFPREFLFCDAGHSVHPLVCLNKKDCSLHIMKHLTTLHNIFSIESIHEQCIETIHVLVVSTERILFL